MVKWWHCDPMGAARPSKHDTYELEAELRRRLKSVKEPALEDDEDA